ncbi:MAG TPA: acyl-CoA dehydrogenase family protein [Pseudomonadales bacterium]|nr:acyl-CoA dehydrogenase family protein [Pseudomonadales bacterium]
MNFGLSEEQKDIQTLANQILGDQVTPEELHKYDMWKQERYSGALWAQLADAGLLGIAIPEDKGGMGFGFSELALFIEECGRVLAPVPAVPSLISALAVKKYGNAELQAMLGGVATGEVVLTAAFHEENTFDAYTPNISVSNGKLSGKKLCVPYANIATRMLVVAKDGKDVALFIVDPKDASVKLTALKATTYEPQFIVEFSNTPAQKLGGADAVKYLVERYTAALCAYQTGAAEKMVQMTAAYTSEREQFNVKIASFQAVGHRVANCYIDAKCLKLVTQQAVELLAQEADATRQLHAAKIWLGDAAHRISYATQHLHGGMGVDRDYPLWRFALWAKQNELMLGSSTQHQIALGNLIAAGAYDID